MTMKNELKRAAFFNDLELIVDDIELLLKDYGYDVDELAEYITDPAFDLTSGTDPDILTLLGLVLRMKELLGSPSSDM